MENEVLNVLEQKDLEFKDYSYPIRSYELFFILKKTICSFLNSIGGVILIGIKDQGATVRGMFMRKNEKL